MFLCGVYIYFINYIYMIKFFIQHCPENIIMYNSYKDITRHDKKCKFSRLQNLP